MGRFAPVVVLAIRQFMCALLDELSENDCDNLSFKVGTLQKATCIPSAGLD